MNPTTEVEEVVRRHRREHYWHRADECVFNPTLADMREPDAIETQIVKGWAPDKPFIDTSTRIAAFGSCFASNISEYLNSMNYNLLTRQQGSSYIVHVGEQLVNTFAIRQQFEWAFENKVPEADLWFGAKAKHFGYDENVRRETLELFNSTDVFILTFGLSEIWYDEPTGAVFWKAVPQSMVDPSRHKFRVSTMAENADNIRAIYRLIRKYRPEAKLICTLSPIPLIATFRPVSCITANAVSKAILRAALDEVWREVADEGFMYYWPSYEIVTEGFGASPHGGHFAGDRRHANEAVIQYIMRLFEHYYCSGAVPDRSVIEAYVEAKVSALELPAELIDLGARKDRRGLQNMINGLERRGDLPTARLTERYAAEVLELTAPAPEEADWQAAPLGWMILKDRSRTEPGPQVLPIPPEAWNYGASSDVIAAPEGRDIEVRITLRVRSGVVGLMLIRPDGSALSEHDVRLAPQDGGRTETLVVFHGDGPAHLLVRNYDSEGVAGEVEVQAVEWRQVAPLTPALGGAAWRPPLVRGPRRQRAGRPPKKERQVRAINAYLTGEPVAEAYDAWASDYDADLVEQGYVAPKVVARIAAQYCADRDARVLDAGCGTGLVGAELSALGFTRLDGVDISPQMLAEARARGLYGELAVADMNQPLDLPSDHYDLVVSAGTFETGLVLAPALAELARVTRPDGILCISIDKRILDSFDIASLPIFEVHAEDIDVMLPRMPGDDASPYELLVWRKTAAPAPRARRGLLKLFG